MKSMLVAPHESNVVPFVAGADASAGDLVAYVAGYLGIVQDDVLSGAEGVMHLRGGHYKLPALSSGTWSPGEALYWDTTPGELTNVATGNTLVGAARGTKLNGETTADLIHNIGVTFTGT